MRWARSNTRIDPVKSCGLHKFPAPSKGAPSRFSGTSPQGFSGYTPNIVPAAPIPKRVSLSAPYYNSQLNRRAVSLRGTEMVPHYAYEDEPTIYLRRTARPSGPVSGPRSGPPTTSSTVGGDTARIGHVYKFHTPKCETPISASLIFSSALS